MDAVVREALSDVQDMEHQVLGAEDHEARIIFSLMCWLSFVCILLACSLDGKKVLVEKSKTQFK